MKANVAVKDLPAVVWGDAKVITTQLLARQYGATEKQLQDNYQNNKDRFVEEKHFFLLKGEQLRELKQNRPDLIGSVVGAKAKSLILWTERGAARHAKMLETERAWDVFEALEDNYFRARAQNCEEDESELSTVRDREPLLHAAVAMVVKHRFPFNVVYQTMNYFAGSARFRAMTKEQVGEVAKFVERLMLGNDTRQDWARIEANRKELLGIESQPEMTGFVVPGTLGGKLTP